jgi:hypothetical protein
MRSLPKKTQRPRPDPFQPQLSLQCDLHDETPPRGLIEGNTRTLGMRIAQYLGMMRQIRAFFRWLLYRDASGYLRYKRARDGERGENWYGDPFE